MCDTVEGIAQSTSLRQVLYVCISFEVVNSLWYVSDLRHAMTTWVWLDLRMEVVLSINSIQPDYILLATKFTSFWVGGLVVTD